MAEVNGPKIVVPRGQVKHVHIKDIVVPQRFRVDYGDIEGLAASIKEKGVIQPITLSTGMELQAGGRRLAASKSLGLATIPALVRESEGEIDLREVELIENLFRKDFTWAEECALIQEIDRLYKAKKTDWSARKTGAMLSKSIASISRALQLARGLEAIPELKDSKTADEAFKTIKALEAQAITAELARRQSASLSTGQGMSKDINAMLRRATSNYMIGDTFKGLAGLRNNGVVHFIECDPPYGIDLPANKRSKDNPNSTVHDYNEVPAEQYVQFLHVLCQELYRVAAADAWLVFWFGPTWFTEVKGELKAAGWQVDDIPAIWAKPNGQTMQPERYLGRAYEPFFTCRKGSPAVVKKGRLNVFNYAGAPNKIHPTERPVELIEDILGTFSTPTSTVLIPFLGSGNTIRAAYNLGMAAFGWDLSDEYKPQYMLRVEADGRALLANEE